MGEDGASGSDEGVEVDRAMSWTRRRRQDRVEVWVEIRKPSCERRERERRGLEEKGKGKRRKRSIRAVLA
jgi:hypothetical protein